MWENMLQPARFCEKSLYVRKWVTVRLSGYVKLAIITTQVLIPVLFPDEIQG